MNITYPKIRINRTPVAGRQPSPATSNNHTDGTWSIDKIYEGELYYNLPDNKLYTRYGNNINLINNNIVSSILSGTTLVLTNASGSTFSTDLSSLTGSDTYTVSAILSGSTAIFTRNDEGVYQLDLNGLSGLTSSVLTFEDFYNFPESGVENTIYIDKLNQNLYYWDNGIGDYSLLTVDRDTYTETAEVDGTSILFTKNDASQYSVDIESIIPEGLWEQYHTIEIPTIPEVPATYAHVHYKSVPEIGPPDKGAFVVTADVAGSNGNSIIIKVAAGSNIEIAVSTWNNANHSNTCTITYLEHNVETFFEETVFYLTGGNELVPEVPGVPEYFGGIETVGTSCAASGSYSTAEGNHTIANGYASHAEGSGIEKSGSWRYTIANGYASHAEGFVTQANGYASHAEGENAIASGDASHAEGNSTTASGYASHAEGNSTTASGDASHAEGVTTIASGYASHAEGTNTQANGELSHAEGTNTQANGELSHAEGNETTAHDYCEHVGGQYNIIGTGSTTSFISSDNLFTLGNGADTDNRSNAFQVKKNGDVKYSGILTGKNVTLQSTTSGGGYVRKFAEATGTPSGSTSSFIIPFNIPAGCKIVGTQLRVDTALTTGETWGAVTNDNISITQEDIGPEVNNKISTFLNIITAEEFNIKINSADIDNINFTDGVGVIRAIVYYEEIVDMDDVPIS